MDEKEHGASVGGVAALAAEMHGLVDMLVQLDPEGVGYADAVTATETARDELRWALDNAGDGGDEDNCCHHPGSDQLCDDCGEGHTSTYACICDCHPELTPDPEDFAPPGLNTFRPAPATIDCDPGELYQRVTDAEADGDYVAAAQWRYLAVDAMQLRAARDRGTRHELERARVAAAMRVLGRMSGVTPGDLDSVRVQVEHRVGLELNGVHRDHVWDAINRDLIRDGFSDTPEAQAAKESMELMSTLVNDLWPDIVAETAAWAGRYAAPSR